MATPHYGVEFSKFEASLNYFFCPASLKVQRAQEQQMQFGSNFLWVLHQQWMNTPFAQAQKQDLLTVVGTYAVDDDLIVPVPSATLHSLSDPEIRARYVNRPHTSIPGKSGVVDIVDANDETFKLVKSFLLARTDECDTPTCQRNLGSNTPGMILMRLVDKNCVGKDCGIDLRNRSVLIDGQPPLTKLTPTEYLTNPDEHSTVTIDFVLPGTHDITIGVYKNLFNFIYGPTTVNGVLVVPARTTVPDEVKLPKGK